MPRGIFQEELLNGNKLSVFDKKVTTPAPENGNSVVVGV